MVAIIESKPLQQAPEVPRTVVPYVHDSPRAMLMTVQDHYLQVAQNTFTYWMDLFTWQIESTECLLQPWEKQIWEQQKVFQGLMSSVMQSYMDFFLRPFALSRQLVRMTQAIMQQEELINPFDDVVAALSNSREA